MPQLWSTTKLSLVGLISISVLSPVEVSAATFSKLYVFGDSLSDAGNVFNATLAVNDLPVAPGIVVPPVSPPDPPYFQGRNSNGPVWVEYLADGLELSLTNSTELSVLTPTLPVPSPITLTVDGPAVSPFFNGTLSTTGVNFAFGGAQTGFQGSTDFGELIPGVLTQVGWFETDLALANATADPNALYVVWAGANDYWGADLGDDPDVLTSQSVSNLETAVQQLYATGARNFLVPNLPDLGRTPRGLISDSESQRLSNLALTHNSLLDDAIGNLGLLPGNQILALDAFSLFNQAISDPAVFGYSNVTDGCLLVSTCLNNPASQDSFLFWDDRHPTTAAHQELAQATFIGPLAMKTPGASPTAVPEPSSMLTLVAIAGAAVARRKQE
ncbi:MAG: SGNH/GDSL hydrolase family protein [Cyanobacteria bacterium P01_B01_bin.77]